MTEAALQPIVTVITPTKNRLELLKETMDSVNCQTLSEWEHIIVDDGSNDGTPQEVERRSNSDPRITYIERTGKKKGANVCRNIGLYAARSSLVVFLDSDDLLEPGCLERRVEIMRRNLDIHFAVFLMEAFLQKPGDMGRRVSHDLHGDDLLSFLLFELPWQTSAPIWRREVLERLGGFDEALPSWQDVDLHVRALTAGLQYLKFPIVDYHMRWQEDPEKVSTLQRRAPHHLLAAEQLVVKFEYLVREGPGLNWVRQRALCSLYFFISEKWVDAGSLGNALRCWILVRKRMLGNWCLLLSGAAVLLMRALVAPAGERLGHKWKGWARLRTNPELVSDRHRRVEN